MSIPSTQLAAHREINWEELARMVELSILRDLQSDEEFANATSLRSQCYHVCRILRSGRGACTPYSMIGRVLGTDKKRHALSRVPTRKITSISPFRVQGRGSVLLQASRWTVLF
jgi:hypothetical protein